MLLKRPPQRTLLRVPETGTGIFKRLFDSGIQNIIIPKVETGEEVEQIMYWASYAPRGNRGFGATAVRAGRFGRHADYLERETDEICILPQIESKRGYENLDAIAKVPGIGGVFLGPIDLAVDMGHGIDIFHPEVAEAMDDMIKRIKALRKPVGTIAVTPEQANILQTWAQVSWLSVLILLSWSMLLTTRWTLLKRPLKAKK